MKPYFLNKCLSSQYGAENFRYYVVQQVSGTSSSPELKLYSHYFKKFCPCLVHAELSKRIKTQELPETQGRGGPLENPSKAEDLYPRKMHIHTRA